MKYDLFVNKIAALLLGSSLLISCTNEPEVKEEPKKVEPKRVMAPFRFHKAIEVKPGLTLDVVSWGRGSDSVGGYLVLRSDSTKMKYSSISGELDGAIVDVWDMDLDSDGNPELYIHSRGEGEGSYLNMYVHEYGDNGSERRIMFPGLSSSAKRGYKGDDSVYIKEGKLMREFPVIDEADSLAKKKMIKRFEYSLSGNSFQVREVEEE